MATLLQQPASEIACELTSIDLAADLRCAMITNVGTFGLRHALAPLVAFSRAPIVVTIGAVHDAPVVDRGELVVRPVLTLGVTLDHRVLDGYQAGRLARRLEKILREPRSALG